jgi:hypothetical protein
LQGYSSLIAQRVKPGKWRTALLPAVPILAFLTALVVWTGCVAKPRRYFSEESFLLFSQHPLAMMLALAALAALVQSWCERRFSRLEIL